MSYHISANVQVCRSQVRKALDFVDAGELRPTPDGIGYELTAKQVKAVIDAAAALKREAYDQDMVVWGYDQVNLLLVGQVLSAHAEEYLSNQYEGAPKNDWRARKDYFRKATKAYKAYLV